MKQTAIRISEEDKTFLKELGGVSEGVRKLIEEKRKRMEGEEIEKTPEDKFYGVIYLPTENHQRNVYQAFVELYIKTNRRRAILDWYTPSLTGATGYDDKTVRKIMRKLVNSGFVKTNLLSFRPTLRIKKESVSEEEFRDILADYASFIQNVEEYKDWWEEEE